MSVPIAEVSEDRLRLWLADCVRDHATPLVLIAVGQNDRSGELHVYRPENGPSDREVGALIGEVAVEMLGGRR